MNDPFAVIVDDVAPDHPLYGKDARGFPEHALAQAAGLAILPALERYLAHMDMNDPRGRRLFEFTSSAPRRIERLLMLRRRAEDLTSRVPSIDDQDDLREVVTLGVVHLMGVFDVLAIVASDVAGLERKLSTIGWQRKDFRKALRDSVSNDLVDLIAPDSDGGNTFAVVKEIRDTIHRRMPDTASSHRDGGDPAAVHATLLFERDFHEEIIDALSEADWFRYEGIERAGKDMAFARPDTLLNLVFSRSVQLFNDLMGATPVEKLGPARAALPPERSLFPISMRRYAVERYRVGHLARHLPPATTE